MAVLTPSQRNVLEKTVIQARRLAETGARNALQALAVNEAEPFSHQTLEQRSLRNRLRNKARLLGDELLANGEQQIDHLVYELTYEYWHQMLFAQFLESNNLLIHPEGVAVTMEECEELAREEGHTDKWSAAAFYASKMLPAIFRVEDPLMQVEFAPNDRIALESLLENLDKSIFSADDALGWVYQFWQSEAKEAINKSGAKINGERLPAVTQLFTEPYMVHFLIDNTLGAWWVSRNPGLTPPVKFEYLRFLEDGSPAAGKFEGWPDKTANITTLDPCMGSGHFVASLFPVLARLRIVEENLSKEEATDKVISENLHGLELDPRCTQIAAFNLALTAWKFCGHYKELPEMHLACSGIAPKGKKEDWVKLVGKVSDAVLKIRMENGMRVMYDHFQLAPELGSLLDPSTIKSDAFTASFEELQPILHKALEGEADKDLIERGVMASGIAKAGQMLAKKYTLQITNVPYLGKGKMDEILADYALRNYPDAKADLATVFLDRLLKTCKISGTISTVLPQNWLFLTTYKKFRETLLKNEFWQFVARLGPGAFSQISGEVVKAILFVISRQKSDHTHLFSGLDVSDASNVIVKDSALKTTELKTVNQAEQLGNPDASIVFDVNHGFDNLEKYADSIKGTDTGDDPHYARLFWEINDCSFPLWMKYQSSPNGKNSYDGKTRVLLWENESGDFINNSTGTIRRRDTLYKHAIAIRLTGTLKASLFTSALFDTNTGAIVARDVMHYPAIFSYCEGKIFNAEVRKLNQKLNVTNAILGKIPFNLDYWQKVAAEKYPNGLPKPYSDDVTQWLYHGHPIKSETPLQVAVARLLGYRWPAESDTEMDLADEARQLIAEIKAFDHLSDEDGILCLPSVNGESAAAEVLRCYLQQVWGSAWRNQTIEELLKKEGSAKSNLEEWLREEFFIQHCKVFQNRPFIWHIWDGRKDGFGALVNYHKLTKENLQKLIYTYLGDWIRQCESRLKNGDSGADGQLSAARKLKEKLELILEGESPYDIFVRWKKLGEQPIGWEPDLNDGVRLNIRPFIQADVLRKKPNIKWGIDRGKNPPGSPWGEIRENDKHLTLAEKRAAREKR